MGETNRTYVAKLVTATRELSAKERVAVKMFIGAEQLDELTQRDENGVLIDIDYVAVVEVYNEKSDNKNYNKYVYVDKDGTMYISGSETLYRTYEEIAEEMEGENEPWSIKVIRRESTNYKGKDFLTCMLV
jgi:hypothetical protein|nr:MAG TPA: ssDNA binding protein [Caudoviricetes sp.]